MDHTSEAMSAEEIAQREAQAKKKFDPFREQRRLMRQHNSPEEWGGEDKSASWMAGA